MSILLLSAAEHETFWTLLCDAAHWEFELFLIILIDVLILGIAWPFLRKHITHHNCPPPEDKMQHTCCHCGQNNVRTVTTSELQSNPKEVMERAEREGTLTLVDDKGRARLLISVFGED